MATIVFCVHPIAGSVNASLKTAKELQASGHQVYFLGLSRCEKWVTANGFSFIPVFEKWFPKDNVADISGLGFWQKISIARQNIRYIKTFIAALLAGEDKEFFDIVEKIQPDLMVIVATHYDSFIWGLLSCKAKIKSIYLYDTLCGSQSTKIPPITTALSPNDSFFSPYRIAISWKIFLWFRGIKEFLSCYLLNIQFSSSYGIASLCEHYHYPYKLVDTSTDMLMPKLTLPEIVLCPKAFDFPDCERVGRYYAGASIDLTREQAAFTWEKIKETRPLIYCALGSLQCLGNQESMVFFQTVIDAAQHFKDWNWVVVTGAYFDSKQLRDIPENVLLVDSAPQLTLLKKASIMINHGGTNTVKECILFGVPMIVFPLAFDNYGNAARVAYRGLGLVGDSKKLKVSVLVFMLEQLSQNPYYRMQVKFLQKEFEDTEKTITASSIINNIILAD